MKNKKIISIFVLYLFLLTVLPMSFIANKVNAEENNSSNIPTYTYYNSLYNGLYCNLAIQYKDKTVFENSDWNTNYTTMNISSKGKTSQITGLTAVQDEYLRLAEGTYNNNLYFSNYVGDIYSVDVDSSQASLYKRANLLNGETCIELWQGVQTAVDNSGDCWYRICTSNNDNYATSSVVKSTNGYRQADDNNIVSDDNMTLGQDGSIWITQSYLNYGNKLVRISQGTPTQYDLEDDGSIIYQCFADANGNVYLYCELHNSDTQVGCMVLKHYVISNGKLVLSSQIKQDDAVIYTMDSNGKMWSLSNGIISKLENDSFTSKYKVNNNYGRISVYDDNNMVVYNDSQYTIINNDGTTDNGQPYVNTTPQVNEQGNNENVNVDTSSLNKNVNTVVQVNVNDPSKNIVFSTDQINELVNNGSQSSAQIINSLGQIILPFQMLDLSNLGLHPESRLSFNESVDTASDILKNIRSTGKVFEFNLFTTDSQTGVSKAIHNFKNGMATITIKLSPEDIKGLDASKFAMLYYNETTKTFENLGGTFDKTKLTFTFKTPHFSKFVLAEVNTNGTAATNNTSSLPSTGSMINIDTLAFAGIAFLGAGSFVLLKKREN